MPRPYLQKKPYIIINQPDVSDFKRFPFLLKYFECKMLNTQTAIGLFCRLEQKVSYLRQTATGYMWTMLP